MDTELIGSRLKQIREKRQLSLDEASEGTGIKIQRLKNLENGTGKLRLEELFAATDFYDVVPGFILGDIKIPIPVHISNEQYRLLVQLNDMTPEELDELRKNLEAEITE